MSKHKEKKPFNEILKSAQDALAELGKHNHYTRIVREGAHSYGVEDTSKCRECNKKEETSMQKQQIIIICGPDMCGKTEISKELSKRLNIPYFKANSEHDTYLNKKDLFLMQLRYADPRVVDLLSQTGQSILFDRAYPCEWVYAQVFDRTTDYNSLRQLDNKFASLGAKIVITKRKSYAGIVDDIDDKIKESSLNKLDMMYDEFAGWTKCDVLKLYVDDENLEREVSDIMKWLGK